jgi:hypothetical protein
MKITESFGPLLDCGDIDGGSYELRGESPATAMVYAYIKVGKMWRESVTQKGGSPAHVVASVLIADLKKKAA